MIFFKKLYNKFKKKANSFIKSDYHIISLGPSCFPKTILTRWKLKKIRAHGEISLPFDLAWFHSASFITDFIENNFENFFENMKYIDEIQRWDNFGKTNFSHETSFGPQDKELLIKMYKTRIKNFTKFLNDSKPILFVQFLKDDSVGEDTKRLYEVIKSIRKEKLFEILIIDANNIIQENVENINILKNQIPFENYNLYDSKCYKSKAGKKFEEQIIDFCKKIIKEKLKLNVIKYY